MRQSPTNSVNTKGEEWKLLDKVFDLAMKHQLKGMARYEQSAKKKSAKNKGKKTKNMKKLETGDIPKNFVTKELYSNVTVTVRFHTLKMLAGKKMSIAEVSSLVDANAQPMLMSMGVPLEIAQPVVAEPASGSSISSNSSSSISSSKAHKRAAETDTTKPTQKKDKTKDGPVETAASKAAFPSSSTTDKTLLKVVPTK